MFLPIQVAKTSTLVWQGLILSEYSDDLETSVCNWKGSLHADKNQWQGIHARVHPGNFSNYIDKGKFSSAEIWGDDDISNLLPNPQGWEIRQCRQMENTRAPALIKLTGEWSWKLVPHRHPKSSIPLHTPLKTETKPANLVTNRAGWAHESPTEGDALHVAEEERWKSSSGRSQDGHLGVPAWDFSFQKTSLGFRQAVWGLAGGSRNCQSS